MGVRVRYGPLAKAADLIVNRIEDAKRMARPVVVGVLFRRRTSPARRHRPQPGRTTPPDPWARWPSEPEIAASRSGPHKEEAGLRAREPYVPGRIGSSSLNFTKFMKRSNPVFGRIRSNRACGGAMQVGFIAIPYFSADPVTKRPARSVS